MSRYVIFLRKKHVLTICFTFFGKKCELLVCRILFKSYIFGGSIYTSIHSSVPDPLCGTSDTQRYYSGSDRSKVVPFYKYWKNRASRYSFLHRKPNCCPRTTIHVTMSTRSTKASTFGLRSRIIRAQPSTSKCTIKTYLQYFPNVKAIQNKNSLQHSFRNKIKQKDTHITKENIKI